MRRRTVTAPRHAGQTGFTLLEMLAVIVLIGIIGSIVVGVTIHNLDRGKYKTGQTQLNTLSAAIGQYTMDNGSPPPDLKALLTQPSGASDWLGPYAKASQLKDPWGHAFGYKVPGDPGSYELIFYGQDGRPGGDKLDKDVTYQGD
jgi:general secretion pathway protein G